MKGMGVFIWIIGIVAVMAILLFAGEALYGIAQLVASVMGQVAAQLQAVIGSLI
jgi:hypothetical protein